MVDIDSTQDNKIRRVLSFEDVFKSSNNLKNLQFNSTQNIENLSLIDNKTEENSKSSNPKRSYYIHEKKLTANSKKKLGIRLAIVFLTLIFISLQSIVSNSLTSVEKNNNLFSHIQDLIPYEALTDYSPLNIFNTFKLIINKDFISGLSCLLYVIFHPFIALKLIYSVCTLFYILIIVKCFAQNRRPLWEEGIGGSNENDIIVCETSFSNPSGSIFIINFYFLYSIFCIKEFYKKNKNLNIITKIVFFLLYIIIIIFEYFFLLTYKLNYLHEMVFTNILTMVIVCILIDFDSKYQKKFFNATKNIFKARKNKIKSLIYCFGLMCLSIILYNFISPKGSLFSVEQKLAINKSCSQNQRDELGLKSTFNDIPYIFCMMGAFWGSCLTIENNPGEWWYQPLIIDEKDINKINLDNFIIIDEKISIVEILLLILKSIIMIIVYLIIWFGFFQIPYFSFEFNFLVACIKYFTITFICTGIIPIIFGFLKMNKNIEDIIINDNESSLFMLNEKEENKKKKNKNIFSTTLFIYYHEKARYPFLHMKLKNDEKGNEMIYSFSEE